jgi:serine/threonine protein kinase
METCPEDGSRLLDLDPGDREDPLVGTLFDGRFRVVKKLGEGGMGNVYSARQVDFERDVALKILKADFLRDEDIRKRFMYEARAISNLQHPHALRLFDFGQAPDGSFYMVMELLQGESLADRLAYRFVSFEEVFNIVPPVCGVLYEAHQNKVIHRDLKPENIYLVDVNDRSEFTKLLDFGIAKHLQDRTMTKSGTLWGTPAYMSPEQAKGDTVGAHADIYAIGIILFELISGNLPFHSETQMGLAMKHINVGARPLRSVPGLGALVPEALDELVMQCLEKDPAERPQDAEEIAQRLERIRDEYFDDELLACVPAGDVDAIALQDWIADEPDVSDEMAIPALAQPAASVQTPSPDPAHLAEFHSDSQSAPRSVTATSSVEEVEVIEQDSRHRLLIGSGVVALMIMVATVIAIAMNDEQPVDEEAIVVTPDEVVAADENASGAAGAAASSAATVIVNARNVTEAVHASDDLAADIASDVAPSEGRPSRSPTEKELKEEAKKAIERTF